MKKIFLMIAMVLGMITMQSCKDTQFGVDYSVAVTGDADGGVLFNVPVGTIKLDGDAKVDINLGKTPALLNVQDTTTTVYVLADAVKSNDVKVAETANAVNEWFTNSFYVSGTTADASYYVHIVGFVRERVTGLTFAVDREFTNRKTPPTAE